MTVPQKDLAGYDLLQQVWINRHMDQLANIHRRSLTNPNAKQLTGRFDHSAYGTNGYKKLRVLDGGGHPATILQKLVSFSGIYDFLDLKPYQVAQLVPSIRLYREIRHYNEDRTEYETSRGEIYFSNYLSEYSIEQILNKSEALGNEVGIKEFSFDDLGKHPGVGGRVFQCKLKLYAKSLQGLAKRQYDLPIPPPPGQESWNSFLGERSRLEGADYAEPDHPPSFPISAAALLVPPNYQADLKISKPDNTGYYDQISDNIDSMIKIRIGWSVLPNSNLAIELGHGASYLNACLALMTQEFELYFSKYDISFEEDGSVSIDIDYRGNAYEKQIEWQQDILSGGAFEERTKTADSVRSEYSNARQSIGLRAIERIEALIGYESELYKNLMAAPLSEMKNDLWGLFHFQRGSPAQQILSTLENKVTVDGEEMYVTNVLKEVDQLCRTLINRFVFPVVNYYGASEEGGSPEAEYVKMIHFDNGKFSKSHLTNYNDQSFAVTGYRERLTFYNTLAGNTGVRLARGAHASAVQDALMAAGQYFMEESPMNLFVPNKKRLPAIANIRSFASTHGAAPTGQFKAASLMCIIATGTWVGPASGDSPPGGNGTFPPLLVMPGTTAGMNIRPAHAWLVGVNKAVQFIKTAINSTQQGLEQDFWSVQASTQYDQLFSQLHGMGRIYAVAMTQREFIEGKLFDSSQDLIHRMNSTNAEIGPEESLNDFKQQTAEAGKLLGFGAGSEFAELLDAADEEMDVERLIRQLEQQYAYDDYDIATMVPAAVDQILEDAELFQGEIGIDQLKAIVAEINGNAYTDMDAEQIRFWNLLFGDERLRSLIGGESMFADIYTGEIEAPERWDRENAAKAFKKIYFTYLGDVLEAIFSLHPGSERRHPKVMLGQYYYSRSGAGGRLDEFSHNQSDMYSISLADIPISISLLNKVWKEQVEIYATDGQPCTCQMFVSHLMQAVNKNIFDIQGDQTTATIVDSAWAGNDVYMDSQYVAKRDLKIPGVSGQTFFQWWPKHGDSSNRRLNAATSAFKFPIPFTNNDLNFSDITFIYGSNAPLPRSLNGDMMIDLFGSGGDIYTSDLDTGQDEYYQKHGPIYHLRYGADSGIVKKIDFSTLNNPHLATHFVMEGYEERDEYTSSLISTQQALSEIEAAKKDARSTQSEEQTPEEQREQEVLDYIASTGGGSFGEQQVRVQPVNLFNQAKITLIGNSLFKNGSYVYIDPKMPGMPSNIMMHDTFVSAIGIGGYYIITKYSGVIKDGSFEVELDAILEFNQEVVNDNRIYDLTEDELDSLSLDSLGEWEAVRYIKVEEPQ